MRVFVDTNVLLSALLTRGLCRELVERLAAEHQPVISAHVEGELKRVLSEKFGASTLEIAEALALFVHWERANATSAALATRDPGDDQILSAAMAGKCEILVTGDRDLTDLPKDACPVPIMTPRQLFDLLNRQ